MAQAASAAGAAGRPKAAAGARWVARQPLLHFLLIGAALSAASAWSGSDARPVQDPARRIVWTASDVRRVVATATVRLRRPPDPGEVPALLDAALHTEILAREAVRLGLDRDDPLVKARLAEKMDVLAEDGAMPEPDAAELDAWIARNPTLYAAPSRIAFRQAVFSFERHGELAQAHAAKALEEAGGGDAADAGDDIGLRPDFEDYTPQQVAPLFGPAFSASLFALEPGPAWHGPVRSGIGWHLVQVAALARSPEPDAQAIRAAARADWVDYQRVEARRRFYERLRAQYQVVLPGGTGQP